MTTIGEGATRDTKETIAAVAGKAFSSAPIIGAAATELIVETSLARHLDATVEEIHGTIHPHPTLGEAVMEAAAATTGEAIHIQARLQNVIARSPALGRRSNPAGSPRPALRASR